MDTFVLLSDEERRAYFETAAEKLGLAPELVEKDFWVCWILRRLFSLKDIGAHLTFKGGTSLSKVYKTIRRFSEDVDVSIERSYLGFGDKMEPEAGKSNKEKMRRIEGLQQACQNAVIEIILPQLTQETGKSLKDTSTWAINLDPDDRDKQTLSFQFPNAVTTSMEAYSKPAVKIELGARSDHWPVESADITPYLYDIIPKSIAGPKTSLRVLSAERTFWEKATILHMLYHLPADKNLPLRMSRHYYDTSALSQTPICERALKATELLARVAEHKKLFFRSTWANYDKAKPGTLRLVPSTERINSLKNDYRQMEPMFFDKPPNFDIIIQELIKLEKRINSN